MGLKTDLMAEVGEIFRNAWDERDGKVVPSDESLTLGNVGIKLLATVLYADLAESTGLVDDHRHFFSAEIYKTYLHCAAKIIRSQGGVITAYDGDRIMAVFIGKSKNTSAVRSAMMINYAVLEIIMPAKKTQYKDNGYELKQVVGIDTSELLITKTGVRGANDLVWVGRAANHAAKLTALPDSHSSYISSDVYNNMNEQVKTSDGVAMWEACTWDTFNYETIYRSNWWWKVDD
jgi:class 3 adenylate cyclase